MADKQEVSAVLHRTMGERKITGYYAGYPIVDVVVVQVRLRLTALTQDQLDLMVMVASVDGWRRNGKV